VGRPIWASPALPGSAHDLTAACDHGLLAALTRGNVTTFADKRHQGSGRTIRTPFECHHPRPQHSRRQKAANRVLARELSDESDRIADVSR
jgi:hypothetical protein